MLPKTYNVYVNEECVAKEMAIEDAVILVKALFQTYHKEDLLISIKHTPKCFEIDSL